MTVHFKPLGVPRYEASETRSVSFAVDGDPQAIDLRRMGVEQAVEQGVLTPYAAANHWEAYDVDIQKPSPPDEAAEFIGF